MSTFRAEVVRAKIEPHPNADKLNLAKVKGWQCCVLKTDFQDGDLGVYLPIDSVLPEALIDKLGIRKNYHKRLRTIKLRGYLSQGLLAPLSILGEGPTPGRGEDGLDVTQHLGITKYEAPIPVYMAGLVRSPHPAFIIYTGIENIKNYPHTMIPGEEVVITEKIHGTNFRAAKLDGELHVGSHTLSLQESDGQNLYWRAANLLDLKNKLSEGDQIFGEVYGGNIQDLEYGMKDGQIDVRVFDIFRGARYEGYDEFLFSLKGADLLARVVPVLYRGPWSTDLLKLAEGKSTLYPDQMREGVVVRPVVERWDDRVGRVILKAINDEYLVRHDATEHH